jgi:prephenate dehydrogenase
MTPEAHDSAVAITSHLPQLLASWLAAAIQETQHEAAGPAFADMTRIAGGSEAIWRDIFSTNSAPLAQAARSLAEDFSKLASDFESQAPRLDHALELLSRARRRNEPK